MLNDASGELELSLRAPHGRAGPKTIAFAKNKAVRNCPSMPSMPKTAPSPLVEIILKTNARPHYKTRPHPGQIL